MLDNDKKRLLELAGIPLTEVTRRGFLAGLGTGAVAGAASGVSRSQQLESVRQWFMVLDYQGGRPKVVGPFDSEEEAKTYTNNVYDKLDYIAGHQLDVEVTDGINPDDFSTFVDKEFKSAEDYEIQHKSKVKSDTYRA